MAFQHAWRTVVDEVPPSAAAIAEHIGKPLADMVSELGGKLPPPLVARFLSAYRHMYTNQDACLTQPFPGVIRTLEALSTFTLGVVTTKEPEQAEIVMRRLQITAFFRHIQGASVGLRFKPAPDTILAALAVLGCAPHNAVMVGDTSADILAGKAAGTKTCAVTYGFGAREVLIDCAPDYVIDSFAELLDVLR